MIASPDYSFLSSTGVKEMATFGGDVADLVPPAVAAGARRAPGGARLAGVAGGQELAIRRRNTASARDCSAAAA